MSDEADVSVAIKAQNPDLETAWRTIAWWEQTCAYWREEAQRGYARRDGIADAYERGQRDLAAKVEALIPVFERDYGIQSSPVSRLRALLADIQTLEDK